MNTVGLSQSIIDFREDNKHLEVTLEEFFESHTNVYSIHNHTLENLFLYFDLDKHLDKDRVIFYKNALWIVDNRKHKFFIFDHGNFLCILNTSKIEDKKKFIFYSSVYQSHFKERFVESKLKEGVYDLPKVFDENTYFEKYKGRTQGEIRKKIYNRLKYPFNYLEKQKERFQVVDMTEDLIPMMETLHKSWVDYKMNDPKTFKMMFSSNRYNRCIKLMFNHPFLKREDFFCKVFYWDNTPVAIRQCLIKEIDGQKVSFDIGFFSLFWEVPSQLILFINCWCLRELKNLGVVEHDTGMLMDKNLTVAKDHFPSTHRVTYKYNLK